ncbi:MAG: helix-turn-helix domain-containing protein [Candidatus Thiodiazotropha sp. (ex Epidulcina cf. delphinae)]|nr:helix-turn-helix domain-containing protein [Candidatus Thiodiazotropha sp. (ex Epidulcina cf. delphinae)]
MIDLGLIAERIRDARINQDLTLDEAAEKTGFSHRTLRRYETDGLQDLMKLDKLCAAYNVVITDIIGGKNDLAYLAASIRRLGPNACDVLIELCRSIGMGL